MKKTLLHFILLVIARISLAQTPQAINYQAVARDNAGSPLINRAIAIKISILAGSATGTAVYAERFTTTTNQLGLFTLEIGRGTALTGTFATINWGSTTYFAKVELDPNGGTSYQLLGTSQLLSVPYALYANKANESQTLSINGNTLSISSGNSVTLPTSGTSANAVFLQQVKNVGYNTTYPATIANGGSCVTNDSLVLTAWNIQMLKKDPATGQYYVNHTYGGNGPGQQYYSATIHQGYIYTTKCIYGVGCFLVRIDINTGTETTMTLSGASLNTSAGLILFSDGTYIYVSNTGGFTKFSVSGTIATNAGTLPLAFSPATPVCVMYDGSKLYMLYGNGLLRVNPTTGAVEANTPLSISTQQDNPKGIIDAGNGKLYLVSSTAGATSTTDYFVLTPLSKP